jgi:hypothetical protein
MKMKKWLMLLILLLTHCVLAGTTLVYQVNDFNRPDSLHRSTRVSLDGAWEYRTSQTQEWSSIQVPHLLYSSGAYTFRKYFSIDSSFSADTVRLVFTGIEGVTSVYLNKKLLGIRLRVSTPLAFDIPRSDFYFNERNELVVDVDTRINYRSSLPHMLRSRGLPPVAAGLIRPVYFEFGQRPNIQQVQVEFASTSLELAVSFQKSRRDSLVLLDRKQLQEKALSCRITVTAPGSNEPLYSTVAQIAEDGAGSAKWSTTILLPMPAYWAPRAAALYKADVVLLEGNVAIDHAVVSFGSSDSKTFSQQKWKAMEWFEDYRLLTLPEQELNRRIEQDMQAIYDAGANAVRVFGRPPSEHLLTVCDRLGLAVFAEMAVVNVPSAHLTDVTFKKRAATALKELVQFAERHPSVVAFGLGSGFDAYDNQTIAFLTEMKSLVAGMDQRPVYAAFRGERRLPNSLPVNLAIYETRPERISDLVVTSASGGTEVMYKLTVPLPAQVGDESFKEQIHAFQVKTALSAVLNQPAIQGVLVSPFRDAAGDTPHLMWGDRTEANVLTAGLYDVHSRQRLAYQVVTSLYSSKPLPELLPGEQPAADPSVFQFLGLGLLVMVLFFIKQDKRMSHYMRRAFIYPHGFYTDLSENRQISPFLTGLVGAGSLLALSMITVSFLYFYRFNTYIDEWLTWLLPSAKLKYYAIWFIWHPAALIGLLALALEVVALFQAMLIKITALWQRRYLRFSQILAFVHWVPACFLFMLPVAIVLFRALEQNYLVAPLMGVLALILLWFIIRTWRGLKVVLQTSSWQAMLHLLALLASVTLILVLYFEPGKAVVAYLQYFQNLLIH